MKEIDLMTAARGNVKYWSICVEIERPGEDGTVIEHYRVFDADSESQAVAQTQKNYEEDVWNVVRLREIKKIYEN